LVDLALFFNRSLGKMESQVIFPRW